MMYSGFIDGEASWSSAITLSLFGIRQCLAPHDMLTPPAEDLAANYLNNRS
jgi:hypothetical protein